MQKSVYLSLLDRLFSRPQIHYFPSNPIYVSMLSSVSLAVSPLMRIYNRYAGCVVSLGPYGALMLAIQENAVWKVRARATSVFSQCVKTETHSYKFRQLLDIPRKASLQAL